MPAISNNEKTNFDAALYEHLIDGIKDYSIFMITESGMIATWNPGVKRLLGFDEEEFIGKPFSSIFTEEDRKLNIPESELTIARKTGKAEDERWHLKKDGSIFWASGLVTLMKNEEGKAIGFTKIMRDQTQKKLYEEQLTEKANSLAIANKELTNFAGVLSHDLNAPLQTVYGFANILKHEKGLNPEAEESVHHIVDGTKRMISLVNQLLEYTVENQNTTKLVFVDTAQLIQEILVSLTSTIERTGAVIHCSGLPTVWADPVQLGRVFQNLIENGIKYRAANRNPEISIRAEDKESEIIFSVKDNGIGVEESQVGRLFTLFERLHPDDEVGGTGIGLATARKVIERLGGRIWVSSKVNVGSVFYFSIPKPKTN
ncbi:MAG: ATP-binding protein [bacterium]|nr:ATP-binding protein [bacterium]